MEETAKIPHVTALAEFVEKHVQPQILKVSGQGNDPETEVLVLPEGLKPHSVKKYVDEYRDAPERRTGTATFADLDSFIAHVNRFKDDDSAIFAVVDGAGARLAAVLDYHRAGAEKPPRFGEHRSVYPFPFSEEWGAWTRASGKAMGQAEFATFIEDRIVDVLQLDKPEGRLAEMLAKVRGTLADPACLMDLSRGLKVHVGERVTAAFNPGTGEAAVKYETQHQGADGQPLRVPSMFAIGIPVFRNGERYQIVARLRYRVSEGAVSWFYELVRTDLVLDDAVKGAAKKAQLETGLPLFYGTPEQ